jgi:hypothetical protein
LDIDSIAVVHDEPMNCHRICRIDAAPSYLEFGVIGQNDVGIFIEHEKCIKKTKLRQRDQGAGVGNDNLKGIHACDSLNR